jgi:hypothetical protein
VSSKVESDESMNEQAVLDRVVDGQHAVLLVGPEEREQIVLVSDLPDDVHPGMWLQVQFEGDQLVEAAVDIQETERVRERIQKKLARLRKRGRKSRPDDISE